MKMRDTHIKRGKEKKEQNVLFSLTMIWCQLAGVKFRPEKNDFFFLSSRLKTLFYDRKSIWNIQKKNFIHTRSFVVPQPRALQSFFLENWAIPGLFFNLFSSFQLHNTI